MTSHVVEAAAPLSAAVRRQSAVLLVALAIAVLGVFPHNLLFVWPLAASLGLSAPDRRLRWFVGGVSLLMLAVGLAQWSVGH